MRIGLLIILIFTIIPSYAQNGYTCFEDNFSQKEWQYLGPVNKKSDLAHQRFGHISCISVNPFDTTEIYIGSPTGALIHTNNRGKSWDALTDNCDLPIIGINDILVDYSKKPHHILIATGTENEWYNTATFGVFKSTDGGKTWLRKSKNTSSIFSTVYEKFDTHNENIFVFTKSTIEKSSDFGESWHLLLSGDKMLDNIPFNERHIRYLYFEPNSNKLYFSTKQKWLSKGNESARLFSISLDNSNRLEELTPLLLAAYQSTVSNNGFSAIQILKLSDKELIFYVSHYNSKETICYTYNLMTNRITDYEVPNASNLASSMEWFSGFTINKHNPKIRYLSSILFYRSDDGGQLFKPMFDYSFGDNHVPHADIRSIFIALHSTDGKNDHIYIGTDGGLSFSNNSGQSWVNLNGPSIQLTQFYGLGTSEFNGTISAGSQDNSIITYVPRTNDWIYNVKGDGYDVAYDEQITGRAYGQYNNRIIQYTNNDSVPFNYYLGLPPSGNSNNRKTLVAHSNGDIFFAAQSLFHLPKGKKKWVEYPTPLANKALSIAVSPSNPNVIYMAGLWGDLIKTTDGGKNWDVLTEKIIVNGRAIRSRIMSICISPYNENRLWIGLGYMGSYDNLCGNSGQLLTSSDGGNTWQDASAGLPVFSVQDIEFLEGTNQSIFAATDQGVYFRRANSATWLKYGNNLPKSLIGELEINYCRGKLLAATYGRGLWEIDIPDTNNENPLVLKRKTTFSANDGEAKVIKRNIRLKRKATLLVDCPVYLPKKAKIIVHKKSQISLTKRGKIINGCNEDVPRIVVK